jgi:hypothetical protein
MKSGLLYFYLIVALISTNGCVLAQQLDSTKVNSKGFFNQSVYDTSYIASFVDIFSLRLLLTNKKNEFTILDKETGHLVDYSPNSQLNIGAGFSYKWMNANLSFAFPGSNNDNDIFGKTRRIDLQTNLYIREFVIDLIFQWYKGFYVANPTLINPGWQAGDPYQIRDDVRSFAMGFTGNYIFNNKKFSYQSAFTFNERQKKSAGSFTAGGGWLLFNLKSDTGLVPGALFPDSIPSFNFNKITLNSFYGMGGYAHTFVVKNWYLTLALGLGAGFSTSSSKTTTNIKSKSNASFNVVSDFRGSLGYNSDRFYVGLSYFTGAFTINSVNDIIVTYQLSRFNLFVGYRFYKWFHKNHGRSQPDKFF